MIEIKGSKELQAKLDKLANLKEKISTQLYAVGVVAQNEIRLAFEDEQSPFGDKWAELSDATKNSRLRHTTKTKRSPILRKLDDSGNLRQNWVIVRDGNSVIIKSTAKAKGFPYGLTHQYGSSGAGRGKKAVIPKRPFLPIENEKISKALKKAIDKMKKNLL